MDFAFSDEQEELRRTVRSFLDETSPESEVRRLMETADGFDRVAWTRMAQELGLQALTIPEDFGGGGFGFLDAAVVFEEMGRALSCTPFFATTALAVPALLLSGDVAAAKEYLPGIAAGEVVATVALPQGATSDEPVRADVAGRLTGRIEHVVDGHVADLVLVPARGPDDMGLFAVSGDAAGLTRTPLSTLDQTRTLATLEFSATPGRVIGAGVDVADLLRRTLDIAVVALALEQVGGAQRCLDMAVDYAKTRVQFGRPIGSFQAVKHKCADLLVDVESAKSAAYYAAWCAHEGNDELPVMASLVKSFCSEVFTKAAAENIQIHGGIGFTWEHPAHLYLKRAKSSELIFGSPADHRAALADRLGL